MVESGTSASVAIIGGGAAGALTAIHLAAAAAAAARRSAPGLPAGLQVTIVEPNAEVARGTAYGTPDAAHLLNVPAAGMAAFPESPDDFVRWRRRQHAADGADPGDFAPRREFGRYLQATLAAAYADPVLEVRHVRSRAVAVRRAVGTDSATGAVVETDGGEHIEASAVVIATGDRPPRPSWAPPALREAERFVADPWSPGALNSVVRDHAGPPDVLLVGTGLTMVDVVLSLTGAGARPARRLLAVSRHGDLPQRHATAARPPAVPEVSRWGNSLAELDRHVREHLIAVERRTGDWRPGMDGVRTCVAVLWARLDDADRREFLRSYASEWGRFRHRMPPSSAAALAGLQAAGRLEVRAATVVDATPLATGGLRVLMSDGNAIDAGWVVNCTGTDPVVDPATDPLFASLLEPGDGRPLATRATAGMGLRTRDGRLLDPAGRADAPIWTLGALRRGELWESTAIPEIRVQAAAVAEAVVAQIAAYAVQARDSATRDLDPDPV